MYERLLPKKFQRWAGMSTYCALPMGEAVGRFPGPGAGALKAGSTHALQGSRCVAAVLRCCSATHTHTHQPHRAQPSQRQSSSTSHTSKFLVCEYSPKSPDNSINTTRQQQPTNKPHDKRQTASPRSTKKTTAKMVNTYAPLPLVP